MDKVFNSYYSAAHAYEAPRVVQLQRNLYAVVFPFMKMMTANYMIDAAIRRGDVVPGKTMILETTSGTFGLALAHVCKNWRLPLTLVVQPDLDNDLRGRLERLGAKLEVCQPSFPGEDMQISRLRQLNKLRAQHDGHYWPSQYENPDAPDAYMRLACAIMEKIGPIDTLVGPVGTGGSMCGTTKALRKACPRLKSIGVDACNSIAFGQEAGDSLLGGLGTAMAIKNLDHTVFDEVHWVGDAEAFKACREFESNHGVFAGGSSGCAFLAGRWEAAKYPDNVTVIICPDEGHRYTKTIYNDDYLLEHNLKLDILPAGPIEVEHPSSAPLNRWSRFLWNRRTYTEITGKLWSAVDEKAS